MFQELLSGFTSSPQGQAAIAALQKQGISAEEATDLVTKSLPGAAASFSKQTEGHPQPHVGLFNILGGHAGRNFLAGLVAGLTRGEGLGGALEDGAVGVLGGHLVEYLADEVGLDGEKASTVGAALSPFIAHYVHEKLASR